MLWMVDVQLGRMGYLTIQGRGLNRIVHVNKMGLKLRGMGMIPIIEIQKETLGMIDY